VLSVICIALSQLLPSRAGAGDQEASNNGLAVPGAEDTSEQTQLLRRRQLKAAEPLAEDSKPVSTQGEQTCCKTVGGREGEPYKFD
jgi:hypothetical protein